MLAIHFDSLCSWPKSEPQRDVNCMEKSRLVIPRRLGLFTVRLIGFAPQSLRDTLTLRGNLIRSPFSVEVGQ